MGLLDRIFDHLLDEYDRGISYDCVLVDEFEYDKIEDEACEKIMYDLSWNGVIERRIDDERINASSYTMYFAPWEPSEIDGVFSPTDPFCIVCSSEDLFYDQSAEEHYCPACS